MDTVDSFDGIDEDTVIRCPICNRRCQSEIDKYCKHFHASTWDGQFLGEGPGEWEYEKVWDRVSELFDEAGFRWPPGPQPDDESFNEILEALSRGDKTFWLEHTSNILIYNEGTMISGSGYIVFDDDPMLVVQLIEKLDEVAEWLKVIVWRKRVREEGMAPIFWRYLKRRGKKR